MKRWLSLQAVSDTEKAAAAGLEGSYESALDEIEADSLLRGLEEVVAEFPHINRNVAEMTLKVPSTNLALGQELKAGGSGYYRRRLRPS